MKPTDLTVTFGTRVLAVTEMDSGRLLARLPLRDGGGWREWTAKDLRTLQARVRASADQDRREVLQLARRAIEAGDDVYLCDALGNVRACRPDLGIACLGLREIVQAGIAIDGERCWSLSAWVYETYGTGFGRSGEFGYDDYSDQARLARLAWVDKLLETA